MNKHVVWRTTWAFIFIAVMLLLGMYGCVSPYSLRECDDDFPDSQPCTQVIYSRSVTAQPFTGGGSIVSATSSN